MWIPASEEELKAAIAAGNLRETASFEAKQQLPEKKKNIDIAIDICAMTVNGGVIMYGLSQDDDGWITDTTPVPIAGNPERITAIANSSISEPPRVSVKIVQTDDDPTQGYIIVVVPPSPRAPHMVIVNNENRYYGRSDTGNRKLDEGDVARLYRRREELTADFAAQLDAVVANSPFPASSKYGNLTILATPAMPASDMLQRAAGGPSSVINLCNRAIRSAIDLRPSKWAPDFRDPLTWQPVLEGGYRAYLHGVNAEPRTRLDLQFEYSGSTHLFCGRACDTLDDGVKVMFGGIIAGLTVRFLHMINDIYQAAGYIGPVNLGCSLDGCHDSILYEMYQNRLVMEPVTFRRSSYRNVVSFPADQLAAEVGTVGRALFGQLFAVLSIERIDPFTWLGYLPAEDPTK
jgi:hypothetical protein